MLKSILAGVGLLAFSFGSVGFLESVERAQEKDRECGRDIALFFAGEITEEEMRESWAAFKNARAEAYGKGVELIVDTSLRGMKPRKR